MLHRPYVSCYADTCLTCNDRPYLSCYEDTGPTCPAIPVHAIILEIIITHSMSWVEPDKEFTTTLKTKAFIQMVNGEKKFILFFFKILGKC